MELSWMEGSLMYHKIIQKLIKEKSHLEFWITHSSVWLYRYSNLKIYSIAIYSTGKLHNLAVFLHLDNV